MTCKLCMYLYPYYKLLTTKVNRLVEFLKNDTKKWNTFCNFLASAWLYEHKMLSNETVLYLQMTPLTAEANFDCNICAGKLYFFFFFFLQ